MSLHTYRGRNEEGRFETYRRTFPARVANPTIYPSFEKKKKTVSFGSKRRKVQRISSSIENWLVGGRRGGEGYSIIALSFAPRPFDGRIADLVRVIYRPTNAT